MDAGIEGGKSRPTGRETDSRALILVSPGLSFWTVFLGDKF